MLHIWQLTIAEGVEVAHSDLLEGALAGEGLLEEHAEGGNCRDSGGGVRGSERRSVGSEAVHQCFPVHCEVTVF